METGVANTGGIVPSGTGIARGMIGAGGMILFDSDERTELCTPGSKTTTRCPEGGVNEEGVLERDGLGAGGIPAFSMTGKSGASS